jgi:hypothetical protein
MKPKITILTDPVPDGLEFFGENTRLLLRRIYYFFVKYKYVNHSIYRGHFAVTRSLVEGLQKINASFNYNPSSFRELADTVHVVAGVRSLRQMIRLKQQGHIKKLYAGPNNVVFSTDANSILASPEIDGVISHCDFACEFWAIDHSQLRDRCFLWPAGVDTHFWQPDPSRARNRILIFDKRRAEDDYDRTKPYIEYLRGAGWSVDVLVRFGIQGYTKDQYRNLLHSSCLMLGFTVGSESQGIAWAEAWSTDVPTLILRSISNVYQGRRYDCSTAPYLHPKNGLFFDDLEDFKKQFGYWAVHREQFSPRAWTLENMSDEVSATLLYRHLLGTET